MAVVALQTPAQRRRVFKQFRRGVSHATWALLTLFVIAIAALGIYVHTGHGALTPVLSGSMRPGIHPGDVVVTQRVPVTSLHKGDIIVFMPPGETLARVHRLASVTQLGGGKIAVTTKGDANSDIDPWGRILMKGNTFKEQFVIPKVGWLIANGGLRWLITSFVFIAALTIGVWTWRYVRS